MAESGGPGDSTQVSIVSAIALGILLIVTGLMDGQRHEGLVTPGGAIGRLTHVPWEAIMIVGIGGMMTIQVFADVEVGWFDTSGYEGLVSSYAEDTGAPGIWSSFLNFVADNAEFFMPLQAVAEFACAFFLVTLLARTLALLATFGFFFTLMFSEFGVSATIEAGSETTWEWEMRFLTGVIFMLAVAHLARALQQTTWKDRILGDRCFLVIPLLGQFLVAIAGALTVWAVGIQARMFGSGYATVSWRGGLYFLGCAIMLIIFDRMRTRTELDARSQRLWVR